MSVTVNFDWPTIVGLVGTLLVLLAFFLLQVRRLHGDAMVYQLMNALGALGILVSLVFGPFNLPAFLLELAWLAISIYGLVSGRHAKGDLH
ncbi:MAG TPA: hypothetical protein VFP92_04805 [Rhodanobacteraceae bacterium]|nr:hypothetical protein [Rhodanobacteraceae bacterium]